MKDEPYSAFSRKELILRDHLAVQRTVLANERTLLAYIRTALTLFGFGIAFTQVPLFDTLLFIATGWVFIPLSGAVFLLGLWKYRDCRKRLASLR